MQVRKKQLELDMISWFQIGKGVHQGYILSPCLFNLYTEYIMRNAGLDGITDSMEVRLSELRELVRDREAWRTGIHRVTKSRTRLSDRSDLMVITSIG